MTSWIDIFVLRRSNDDVGGSDDDTDDEQDDDDDDNCCFCTWKAFARKLVDNSFSH